MKQPKWHAALLATTGRLANSQLGQALRQCAQVIHLAPGLLPAGLGLLPSQQEKVAEELEALFQPHAAVDEEGPASLQGGPIGGEVEVKASNAPELADAVDGGVRARPSS
ncbi:MAG: hypothetical protein MUP40_02825 [Actinobacteria bacterium]|nr:hypothetical protein [Actinomycetota bacterium]